MPKSKPAEIKTKATELSPEDFIAQIPDEQKRADSEILLQMMKKATGEEPKLWSNSTIGFGMARFRSERTGREVDWFRMGFAPRKANMSLHLGLTMERHAESLQKLGKHKTGVGCLYISKLADVDVSVLKAIIETAAAKH